MKHLVLIFGNAQHGKNALGAALAAAWREQLARVELMAFADPVKRAAMALLGMPREVAYGGEEERRAWKRWGRDGREWLQWVGTEVGRNLVDRDLWVHRLVDRALASPAGVVIVTDGRFANELEIPREHAGPDLRVTAIRIRRPSVEVDCSHPSEGELRAIHDVRFDWVVNNTGTLEELRDLARDMANRITRPILPSEAPQRLSSAQSAPPPAPPAPPINLRTLGKGNEETEHKPLRDLAALSLALVRLEQRTEERLAALERRAALATPAEDRSMDVVVAPDGANTAWVPGPPPAEPSFGEVGVRP